MTDKYTWGGGTDTPDTITNAKMNQNVDHLGERIDREAALSRQFSVDYSTTNSATLTLGIYGGQLQGDDGPIVVSDQTLALTSNATNYVEQNWSTGEITKNTSGFTPGARSLFVVVCGPSAITSITDRRGAAGGSGAGAEYTAGDGIEINDDEISLADDGVTDEKLGDRTIDQSLSSPGNTGPLTSLFSWLAGRIKAITGKTNWYDSPDITLASTATHVAAAAPHAGHLNIDGSNAMTGALDLGGQVATNGADGVNPTDLATKQQVDAVALGYKDLANVVAMSTANLGLSGLAAVDGVSINENDRVLAAGQSAASENGVWEAKSGAWVRPADFDTGDTPDAGTRVFVKFGTVHKGQSWALLTSGVTIDTDPQEWTQTGAPGVGESNTMSNAGTGTGLIYAAKTGVNFALRSLFNLSDRLSIAVNGNNIELDVVEAEMDRNELGGGALDVVNGGTGLSSIPKGSILYASDDNELSVLAPDSDGVQRFIAQTDDGAPVRTTVVTAPGYLATSNSSITTELTSQSFTTQAGTAYVTGDRVRLISAISAAMWVEGVITAYDGTAMTVLVDRSSVPQEDGIQLISGGFKLSLAGEPAVPFPPQNPGLFYAGPVDGDAAEPEFREIEESDIPAEIARVQARGTVQATTTSLADDATDDLDIELGKAGFIYQVETDVAARVRLYTTDAARTADSARDGDTSPEIGDGVMLEVTTAPGDLVVTRDRPLPFYDIDGTLDGNIPMAVTNLSGSTDTVTVTITRLLLEP